MAGNDHIGESAQTHQFVVFDHLRAEILKEEIAFFFVAISEGYVESSSKSKERNNICNERVRVRCAGVCVQVRKCVRVHT